MNADTTTQIPRDQLLDKIKGGWAGSVIGCTYGGPTEFQFKGGMIQEHIPLDWNADMMLWYYENAPGLYDDIYMDLTFVEVMEKEGIDAPARSHAKAFANADYMLWHANQAARYNILNGILPPESGHWKNNPHADDIDFQIEADFAGLMSPGMPNAAAEICDRVGHIMNYGDGWYGGVYVAAMYSLAFVEDDIGVIVREALNCIPQQSTFYQCIADVIRWHDKYPDDWKQTWFECEKKWSADVGCPDGVFTAFNIDAKLNAAYVVIGLLYGQGDYGKSIELSTRCGQDSDCNPATAGGIIGTLLGYDAIPPYWKQGLDKVEDMNFKYTNISLNKAYALGFKHALQMIERNGGLVSADAVSIARQSPMPVRFEQAFEGLKPVMRIHNGVSGGWILDAANPECTIEFTGCGFVISGGLSEFNSGKIFEVAVSVDGELMDTAQLPANYTTRKHEIAWRYDLKPGKHTIRIQYLDPVENTDVKVNSVLVYEAAR